MKYSSRRRMFQPSVRCGSFNRRETRRVRSARLKFENPAFPAWQRQIACARLSPADKRRGREISRSCHLTSWRVHPRNWLSTLPCTRDSIFFFFFFNSYPCRPYVCNSLKQHLLLSEISFWFFPSFVEFSYLPMGTRRICERQERTSYFFLRK